MKKNLSEPELKAIIDDILNKYINFIGAKEISGMIFDLIRKEYDKGLQEAEVEFNMNFTPNPNEVQFMQKFAFDNIESLTNEVKDKLRKEISLGLMNNESGHKLYKRVSEVMDMSIERAKMITVTETNRAQNKGFHQAAKETGIKLYKEWNAQPERVSKGGNKVPCTHCEFLDGQVVGIDDMFTDDKGQKFFLPPHHPNCLCRVLYVQKKDIDLKHKYIRREGSSGNYTYYYKEAQEKNIKIDLNNKENLISTFDNFIPDKIKKQITMYMDGFKQGKDSKSVFFNSENNSWSEKRQKIHNTILDKYDNLAKQAIPKDNKSKVIFLAGLPGSGKTFATRNMFKKVDKEGKLLENDKGEKFIVLNADDFKAELPEYNGLNAMVLHEESSYLNLTLVQRYTENNVNIIIDGTLAKRDKALKQITMFKEKGYDSNLIHVDVPVEQALTMAAFRFREEKRFVPYEIIDKYDSKIKDSVEILKQHFNNYQNIDNSMPKEMLTNFANKAIGD